LSAGTSWAHRVRAYALHNKTLDRPFITLTRFQGSIGAWARRQLLIREVLRSRDRIVLQGPLFAALRKDGLFKAGNRILWIGCAPYTTGYYRIFESEGAQCFTIELDPEKKCDGRPGRHTVGSMLGLARHYPARSFNLILCNGVLGWGVNAVEDQRRAFEAMAQALEPGGALIVGWNTDTMADPVEAGLPAPYFSHSGIGGFPSRHAVETVTHVYDCFRRNG
jgi:hypothetical protein